MNVQSLRIRSGRLALVGLLSLTLALPAAAARLTGQIATAQSYVATIAPGNNDYGTPPSLAPDVNGDLHALTKCGSFTALLFMNSYPALITPTVLEDLIGSSSPFANQWYQAIDLQYSDGASGLFFTQRATVDQIQAGDILAALYDSDESTSEDTGHVMTVGGIVKTGTAITPPFAIPGSAKVDRYRVQVYDSTKSVHGGYDSNPYPDSRYKKEGGVDDRGLGTGSINLYADATSHAIVAWAWNVSTTTTSFYYSVPKPLNSARKYRPLVAGYLSDSQP